jgi:hypothetical protein
VINAKRSSIFVAKKKKKLKLWSCEKDNAISSNHPLMVRTEDVLPHYGHPTQKILLLLTVTTIPQLHPNHKNQCGNNES